jgi:XTP/dITP diphosphohydrolase
MKTSKQVNLLIATNNPGKIVEYQDIFANLSIRLTSLSNEGITLDPAETGITFEENAILKAKAFAEASSLLTLADDSGLEIDALGGAPGIYSARYGNTAKEDDEGRRQLVLEKMKDVPWPERTARFRCVVALATKEGIVGTVEGKVEGFIAYEAKGQHGFGYDPIFYYPPFDRTLAQVAAEQKHEVSHRGRAARAAISLIEKFYK